MGNHVMIKEEKETKELIQEALGHAQSYSEYVTMVRELAATNGTTGPAQTEALINYTQLNNRRMKRWDKTLKIPTEVESQFEGLDRKITWLVLTESWCGDASPSLPVMNKLAELSPNLDLKIVLRDEHLELTDRFLTNGARSIPKLIVLDTETQTVLGEWGPRSAKATQMVMDEKAKHGSLSAEFKEALQVFYNKDKGQDIVRNLTELLALK